MSSLKVPFFRPEITAEEVAEVVNTLRSGWLTSGPNVRRFEKQFASAVGAHEAIAVNSGTAALHLAVEAFGLKAGQGVLVPTMTFAATAEVVRYQNAIPILVDCDPVTLNMDLNDAERKVRDAKPDVVGIMPVHVGGVMMDLGEVRDFARRHGLWIVEDSAHAFPAAWRRSKRDAWQYRSNGLRSISCYSFYANKTITTGEGGMAVTNNAKLAKRMKLMSLHGLSHDAWNRYASNGHWDYKIVAPGFKYNLTDIAAAIGVHQLSRAEAMLRDRRRVAKEYLRQLADVEQIELPPIEENRIASWHLFAVKLRLKQLKISRDAFIRELKRGGIGCSVHWRPLHLHPYYQKTFKYRATDFPVATAEWKRLISLPIFPAMRSDEVDQVVRAVKRICGRHAR
jgi:dTDP-4-amino-4,6-dideoxygalactose transaminase